MSGDARGIELECAVKRLGGGLALVQRQPDLAQPDPRGLIGVFERCRALGSVAAFPVAAQLAQRDGEVLPQCCFSRMPFEHTPRNIVCDLGFP